MRTFGSQTTAKQWARLALKFGLLLTDAKLWSAINDQVKERAGDVSDVMKQKYEDTSDRLGDVRDAWQGKTDWVVPVMSFVGGIGLGIGVGILFAPVSGEEARAVLRDKAEDVKNKVNDIASGAATRFRPVPVTGTEG
ncbi:MAG: YtxH domain-containing protein [Terriglobales bacterium]